MFDFKLDLTVSEAEIQRRMQKALDARIDQEINNYVFHNHRLSIQIRDAVRSELPLSVIRAKLQDESIKAKIVDLLMTKSGD